MTGKNWHPPEEYVQVPSSLDGVTVYAPRKEKVNVEERRQYKCPNCGANTRYDVSVLGVACEYCGYSAQVEADQVGRQADQNEFTLETLDRSLRGWGIDRRMIHCDSCGAEIVTPEQSITATCPFCGSNQVNVRESAVDNLRPKYVLPFKIPRDTIFANVKEFLGKGWMHPEELKNSISVDRLQGLFLPFWTFSTKISASWRAQIGKSRTVRDRDGHSHTEVKWYWRSGGVHLDLNDRLVSGSSHISELILKRILPYQLHELNTYSPDFLAGFGAHSYDINLPTAWETCKEDMREEAKSACYSDINESRVRNFSMTADFSDETWRLILAPVYLSSYQYEGKVFQLMANGQTGKVAGQKPVAWWKIWLAIAAMLIPGFAVGLIGLPLLLLSGVGIFPLVLGFILLVVGLIVSGILYRKAQDSEAA